MNRLRQMLADLRTVRRAIDSAELKAEIPTFEQIAPGVHAKPLAQARRTTLGDLLRQYWQDLDD